MGTAVFEKVRELGLVTAFGGGEPCPTVATLPIVDVEALTAGDNDPFYVTLQISEVGRLSQNKVVYDDYLVTTIEETIRAGGVEGLMGHLPDEDLSTTFPHSDKSSTPLAGFWVGVLRIGEILWGKAYIPPGDVRNYMRRVKATNGKLGVSFYGKAIVEVEDRVRRLREFELETLDFAPHKRASLTLAGAFEVTSELNNNRSDEEGEMPEPITLENVPQSVREQIRQEVLKETQATENAQRVAELEQQVQTQEATIAEYRDYGRIVTEISTQVEDGVDIVEWVREMNETMIRLGEILGSSVSIITRVEEYHTQLAEMAQERFAHAVGAQVAELTDWQVSTDSAKGKLDALRGGLQAQIIAQMGAGQSVERVAEVAQSVWDGGYQTIAESVRDSLAGPSALVGGQGSIPSNWKDKLTSDEGRQHLKAKFGA